jgi:periplasmic protein TonB
MTSIDAGGGGETGLVSSDAFERNETMMGRASALIVMLLLGAASVAQDRDPASPKVGNAQRGRNLLAILGPKPHDGAGIAPLQQQELNRRVRCAATRQEIQDQLDFEAAGSPGFYSMPQLRGVESEACASIQLPDLPQVSQAQAAASFRPPPQRQAAQQPQPQSSPAPQQPSPHIVDQAPAQRVVPQQIPSPQPPSQQQQPQQSPQAQVQANPKPQQPQSQQPATPPSAAPSYTPAPDYPHDDMVAGHEGVVVVKLVINPDGSVKEASVAKSSSFPTLDASALKAAATWRIPAAAGRTIMMPLTFSAH